MNILLVFPGFIVAFIIVFCYEYKIRRIKPKNKVHFYVARDKDGTLYLYIGKPTRENNMFLASVHEGVAILGCNSDLEWYGLNESDYDYLSWEDEPVEVFLNMKY